MFGKKGCIYCYINSLSWVIIFLWSVIKLCGHIIKSHAQSKDVNLMTIFEDKRRLAVSLNISRTFRDSAKCAAKYRLPLMYQKILLFTGCPPIPYLFSLSFTSDIHDLRLLYVQKWPCMQMELLQLRPCMGRCVMLLLFLVVIRQYIS